MKKLTVLAWGIIACCGSLLAQNVGINYNGAQPNASSALDINVSALAGQKKGLLIPRVTEAQRLAMNPLPAAFAKGLLVFQTDGQTGFYYNESDGFQPLWIFLPGTNNYRWDLLKSATNPLNLSNGANTTTIGFDGVTSQNAFSLSSNSLTTGSLMNLDVNSTNGTTQFDSKVLHIRKMGVNANNNHRSVGIQSSVYNSGPNSTNYAGFFQSSGATNNYAIVVPADGGRVAFGTNLSSPDAILAIANGHFQSRQTTKPTITANANAGILASGTVADNSSDMAGTFTIQGGGGNTFFAGPQAVITYNSTYFSPPRVILTPVNANAANKGYFVTSNANSFTVHFTTAPTAGTSYTFNYMSIGN
jgi:hypothetical protein